MRHIVLSFVLLSLLLPATAFAHRVNVFAWVEGADIAVEGAFSRDRKVQSGRVDVFDAVTGTRLLEGQTDSAGLFRFPIPAAVRASGHALRLVLYAGEGHQNEWTVQATEWVAAKATDNAPAAAPDNKTEAAQPQAALPRLALQRAELEQIVKAAVAEQIAPLSRQIAELRAPSSPNLRDIIGGIGWILGLFGVWALRGRKRA